MKRVIFVQLPPPRFSFQHSASNIPLAAGFLLSALKSRGVKRIDAQVLDPEDADLFADQGLVECLVSQAPSVLALTLYVWNVQRSLFIASLVKEQVSGIRVLVGGPEVTADNFWVMEHPAVDAGVFGEGESRISRMLEAVTAGEGPDRIPGTFIKRAGRLLIDDDPVPPWDLGSCPYPYLDQAIGPSREGLLFLETMRGCPFRCRYCHYHKAFPNLRLHPWAQIQAVLDLAYSGNSGVEEIYLMDPSFNARPEFRDLLKSMARRRTSGSPRLHAELRADFLTGEDVALFREAGLSSAEVGLQTVNIEALRLAGRSGDPEETAKGVTLLKGSGIEVTTGIIVGLPGDTPEWFERTLQWLKRTESYSVVHPFVLSILPGTDFRANAAQLGLEYDPRPPYYVTSTRTFPVAALHEALDQCETVFDMELDYIPPPRLVDQGPYVIRTLDGARYVSTWIVDTTRADWSRILPGVIKRATDPFTFWFRGPGGPESEKAVIAVLGEFAQANPHCVVHVVFEFMKAPGPPFLDNAVAVASHPGVYVNRAFSALRMEGEVVCPVFWLLWPDPGDAAVRDEIRQQYATHAEVVWDQRDPDEGRLLQTEAPLVTSWSRTGTTDHWRPALALLQARHSDHPEQVLFRDPNIQELWNAMNRTEEPFGRIPESILRST